jgi:uncharacterized OB-fold protein
MSDRPAPTQVTPSAMARGEERHFFEAAREGRIGISRCRACGRWFLPRAVCPHCWSDDVEPAYACGRGTLYSYTVCHRPGSPDLADRVPYIVALVDLEEGTRMLTNLVGVDEKDVQIGMALEATFEERGDVTIPQFKPREGSS